MLEKQITEFIDFDNLKDRKFESSNDFVKLFSEAFEDAIHQLNERGRTNIMFSFFEFSQESDWDGDEYSNHRATMTLYFTRDETAEEKVRREAHEKRQKLEQEKRDNDRALMEVKAKEMRHDLYLKLKAEFEA